MKPKLFAKKYVDNLSKPVEIIYKGETHKIQVNFCSNPFCKWYGKEQFHYNNFKGKPHRYRLSGQGAGIKSGKSLFCNPDPTQSSAGIALNCSTTAYSNWSLAEEIKRLIEIESVTDVNPKYIYHRDGYKNFSLTPVDNPGQFSKRGKSVSNSVRWQCKVCRKITNILPENQERFNYKQKRNEVLPQFANLLLSRVPVKNTCAILKIASGTYYNKLEWLYICYCPVNFISNLQ